MDVKCLKARDHVDLETGCLYRYIYSETEYFRMHFHDYYEIFLTVDAKIVHVVNGQRQTLPEGSLVFIRPSDVHTYEYDRQRNYRFVNLTFTKETVEELFRYLGEGFPSKELLACPLPPVTTLNATERERVLNKMGELGAIGWQDKKKLQLQMRVLLMELFTRYFGTIPQEDSDIPFWLESLCEAMKKPKNFMAGTPRMLELCGKSREHLARSMKLYYGMTISEFINDLRINYVANMLQSSNAPILDLCYESGFQNAGWFYTLFKQKYGVSPKQFRNWKRK